jgi:hypothetical protein
VKFTNNGQKGSITLTWTLDLHDMESVGYVLQRAGQGPKGEIRDKGFYEDGTEILAAVWKAEDEVGYDEDWLI